jgi:hypothetical protein
MALASEPLFTQPLREQDVPLGQELGLSDGLWGPGLAPQVCNLSYASGMVRRIEVQDQPEQKVSKDWVCDSSGTALSSNPSTGNGGTEGRREGGRKEGRRERERGERERKK